MTEEIINGVNVSKCCFYNGGKCDNPNGMACNCINNAVCYFKELKRLEQENKELKKQIESQKGLITVGGKQQYEITMSYDKCKTALEEIRAMINHPDHRGLLNKIEDKINEVLE